MQTNPQPVDWCVVADEMLDGSPVAMVQGTRLVTSFLIEYRAYDFSEHWDDLIRQVLVDTLRTRQEHGHAGSDALRDRMRADTCAVLRERLYRALDWNPEVELPWCQTARIDPEAAWWQPISDEDVSDMRRAFEKLPEQRAHVIGDFYGDGRNFDQIAANRKLPLRLVKRFLRESLWELRDRCAAVQTERDNVLDDRARSCFEALELDLAAFLVESASDEWQAFRTHYPACVDCSSSVVSWTRVEALVRQACGHHERHPAAEDLVALQREQERVAYPHYVGLMRHLDSCYACGESMAVLDVCHGRGIAEWADETPAPRRLRASSRPADPPVLASREVPSTLARLLGRFRRLLGR